MPILELDDGTVIAETLAIMEYLEELYPEPPLLGADAITRALVRMWERRCEIGVYLPASRMVLNKGEVSDHARKTLVARLALVNDGLQGRDWLAGNFSIADIMLFIGLETAHHGQFSLDPAWTNVSHWYAAIKQDRVRQCGLFCEFCRLFPQTMTQEILTRLANEKQLLTWLKEGALWHKRCQALLAVLFSFVLVKGNRSYLWIC